MKNTKNKILWKVAKILWIIVIALFALLVFGICCGPKEKKEVQEQKKTLQENLTPEQEKIIKEHYELYNALTVNAKTGTELDEISKKVSKQLREKYKMTEKEYEQMWDIYNFGHIVE